jgi:4-aminobutyrate aminotransferase / (S)-3-amino-2-methylpropionate transaminase / 5-aminovalerate transaminase
MSFSEIPPPPELRPGEDEPFLRGRPPGPQSRTWLTRFTLHAAPMGPARREDPRRGIRADVPAGTIVYATAKGSNVLDVDGNRYVDLAAGFGALLLGHSHPTLLRVLELQAGRLLQALGDVYPSEAKIALLQRLAELHPAAEAASILGQSGADAVSAALKTALLVTGRPRVVAFEGAYHGLSYAPLAACGLRPSYREPFVAQLNPHVTFLEYPRDEARAEITLERLRFELARRDVGAVLFEPILGRGGCVVPPPEFVPELVRLARDAGALSIADEIWTGLGRAGRLVYSTETATPDLICLGKGLGGGLPISACIGPRDLMRAWSREPEVVHTSTYAGAPLACAAAITTLDLISREGLVERSAAVGQELRESLRAEIGNHAGVAEVRGAGLMIGVDLGERPGAAQRLMRKLLERGYIVSTGGGRREVVVLTPPLTLGDHLIGGAVAAIRAALDETDE